MAPLNGKAAYFQPREWEEQDSLDPESYYRELREAFSRNLPRYFNGRERVGMSLTGGIGHADDHGLAEDSRRIASLLHVRGRGSAIARMWSWRGRWRVPAGSPIEVIRAGEEFLSRFPHYAERTVYLTDACVEVSRSPDSLHK